ncbi:unnamed protein product [marine sediment metagenome]|uniref:Uncharacterized protein n=1 Tax=marine sediment metagenome TaxID=412755 RepID=X1GJ71_9ZZZZ
MSIQRKFIIFIVIISLFLIFSSGCAYVTPDYDNYTVSYIKITPSCTTMKVNTSKVFKLWAYDSENDIIPIDPAGVTWEWAFECPACGVVADVNPESGSITSSFTPYRAGLYYIYAYYKGKKDNSPIEVVQ